MARRYLWLLALVAAALHAAATPSRAADKVVLRINFTPWGMHAPFFGGRAQGFYEREGIDLEIRPPSAGQQNEIFIGMGREQFGLSNADGFIKARGSGVPVVGDHGGRARQSVLGHHLEEGWHR